MLFQLGLVVHSRFNSWPTVNCNYMFVPVRTCSNKYRLCCEGWLSLLKNYHSLLLQLNQSRRFIIHEYLLLPIERLSAISPSIIFWSSWYFSPHIIWPKYINLRFWIKITSLSFLIRLNTSMFVSCYLFEVKHWLQVEPWMKNLALSWID